MEAFDLSEKAALPVQQAHEVVARPVLYEPVEPVERDGYAWRWDNRAFREEPAKAAEMYEAFFDESIVDGEREHEDVGETLPETGVTAVPEPEEWLLLAVGAGMLLWYARKRWPGLLRRRAV